MRNEINRIIENALREDVQDGDHSSMACIPKTAMGKTKLLVKQEGILAGVELAGYIFEKVDPSIQMEVLMKDGSLMKVGDIAFYAQGPSISMLTAERLVLNCMQRMSAIATKTKHYVNIVEGTDTKILDTRKTTPGIRAIEKWAVKIGGGENHRFGLYDMIMLKDNHIDFAGGIKPAIEKTQAYLKELGKDLKIEIETRNLNEVEQVLETGMVNRIMLDNFSYEDTRKAVEMIAGKYETESSGGITEETLRGYAECGVNYISVGAITHSVHSLDLSLKAI